MATISHIKVENFLSLRKVDLALGSLNVLVGPNGAGKTNLLKVLEFLGEVARRELSPAIEQVGGFDNLIFRGQSRQETVVRIELRGIVTKHASINAPDEYKLSFWRTAIGRGRSASGPTQEIFRRSETLIFKRYQGRGRRITLSGGRVSVSETGAPKQAAAKSLEIMGDATGLGTLRRLSDAYGSPEWNAFAEVVEELRLFEINVEKIRSPSPVEEFPRLKGDASNLASFLLFLHSHEPDAYRSICDDVRFILPSFNGFEFTKIGGANSAVRLDVRETGLAGLTPMGRVSFGTIRAIALFAMLHDPLPPKLTALEEIDHGLHPHVLDRIVERLREASKRTQIILATHSPALVNRLERQELIVVEQEGSGATKVFRPSATLVANLRRNTGYELGELWFSGALGGAL